MSLNEKVISDAIITEYYNKFRDSLELDVAIVGGGPSGMTAGMNLAKKGHKVAMFERKLSLGGGMWGGGMTWNIIVVQDESKHVLEDIGVPMKHWDDEYWTCDAVTATTTLASAATIAGMRVFNCMSVEDVCIREEDGQKRVNGLVINSSPVEIAGLHVDPLVIHCKHVIEATGHDTEVLKTLCRKNDISLNTPSGSIEGEQSMWADVAETNTVNHTREVFPGVWVAGMAANATFGSYRMGPVFGGMLLSGEKVAEDIHQRLIAED
ncbi:sulfide-dependent adenosine diphosphate thiazole synthase [Desulfovibrio oxyclinae]|jgi:thiamine thiazole synthase|uniref:sulfide-dependent adenosine diphosphate thiazole synthase n=1 Tax=Desulfovibrio oxyclinae TaxID=63560 RepID=UPI0003625D35|nr:sulfide-dependent adenosine diphosphate thiazole synthase [Desulfovibrio oxyclinae]